MLSREQFIEEIKRGGSVLYNGKVITKLDEVPRESELVIFANDKENGKIVLDNLNKEIDRMKSEVKELEAFLKTKDEEPSKPEPTTKAKESK